MVWATNSCGACRAEPGGAKHVRSTRSAFAATGTDPPGGPARRSGPWPRFELADGEGLGPAGAAVLVEHQPHVLSEGLAGGEVVGLGAALAVADVLQLAPGALEVHLSGAGEGAVGQDVLAGVVAAVALGVPPADHDLLHLHWLGQGHADRDVSVGYSPAAGVLHHRRGLAVVEVGGVALARALVGADRGALAQVGHAHPRVRLSAGGVSDADRPGQARAAVAVQRLQGDRVEAVADEHDLDAELAVELIDGLGLCRALPTLGDDGLAPWPCRERVAGCNRSGRGACPG